MNLIGRLVALRTTPLAPLAKEVLALYGVEVPRGVRVGRNLRILHRGFGTVIHPATTIGDDVTIYHSVTIGRGDPWVAGDRSEMRGIVIEDGVVICPGAKIICSRGVLTVGARTVVAANAVLTRSTGPGEIWAGVPARKIGERS